MCARLRLVLISISLSYLCECTGWVFSAVSGSEIVISYDLRYRDFEVPCSESAKHDVKVEIRSCGCCLPMNSTDATHAVALSPRYLIKSVGTYLLY